MPTLTATEDKIARLLAKAEGTDNPHEAEVFAAKAEQLIVEHAVDRAKVAGRGVAADITPGVVDITSLVPPGTVGVDGLRVMVNALAEANGCRVWMMRSAVKLAGYADDVANVRQIWLQVRVALEMEFASYIVRNRGKSRRSFVDGYCMAFIDRIAATRQRVEEAVTAETGSAVELYDRERRVQALVPANLHNRSVAMGGSDSGAYAAGHEAGGRAPLGQRNVGGGAAAAIRA